MQIKEEQMNLQVEERNTMKQEAILKEILLFFCFFPPVVFPVKNN